MYHHRRLQDLFDAVSDRCLRPNIRIAGYRVAAFHVAGALGCVAALVVSFVVASRHGLPVWYTGMLAAVMVVLFLAQAMIVKIVRGEEYLVHYRAAIVVLCGASLYALAAGGSVLATLDVAALAVGTFTAFGRIGCLMVGCCHGRPCACGVRYGPEHARAGFDPRLVGLRLAPVQAGEALALLAIVATVLALCRGSGEGAAFVWYVASYGAVRFVLEFYRGDADRPYLGGFSEAQWTAAASILLVQVLHWGGAVAAQHGLQLTMIPVLVAIVVTSVARRLDRGERSRLSRPRHLAEVAGAVRELIGRGPALGIGEDDSNRSVRPITTSLGYRISGGNIGAASCPSYYFAISRRGSAPQRRTMEQLAVLVAWLCDGRAWELIEGRYGVFHLLIDVAPSAEPVLLRGHRVEGAAAVRSVG